MPSKTKAVIDVDTSRLQQKLRAMSKHFGALADDLESIDTVKCGKCGSCYLNVEELTAGDRVEFRFVRCKSCGHEENESCGDYVREATQQDFERNHW